MEKIISCSINPIILNKKKPCSKEVLSSINDAKSICRSTHTPYNRIKLINSLNKIESLTIEYILDTEQLIKKYKEDYYYYLQNYDE